MTIQIDETGAGIPSEDLQRTFALFFATREPGQGTSLRLAICRRIAKAHQGSIEVQSAHGLGTTLLMTLAVQG